MLSLAGWGPEFNSKKLWDISISCYQIFPEVWLKFLPNFYMDSTDPLSEQTRPYLHPVLARTKLWLRRKFCVVFNRAVYPVIVDWSEYIINGWATFSLSCWGLRLELAACSGARRGFQINFPHNINFPLLNFRKSKEKLNVNSSDKGRGISMEAKVAERKLTFYWLICNVGSCHLRTRWDA